MKRMSEVFELPANISEVYLLVARHGKEEEKELIVNCINHVDALADALEMMLGENSTMSKWLSDNYWDAEDSENFKQAKKALAAYRGDK